MQTFYFKLMQILQTNWGRAFRNLQKEKNILAY